MAAEPDLGAATRKPPALRVTVARERGDRRGLGRAGTILVALAESDLRARYGRGRWQLVKWLADPFAALGIYLLLVVFVINRPGEAPGLSLACAIVPFQLVMMSVVNALGAIQLRRSIVLNMNFARTLIPISAVLTESVAGIAALVLIPLMMAIYRVAPTASVLWFPVVLVVTLALAIGVAYPAALVGVWFPDLRPFAVSLVRTLYFLAPGLVSLAEITGRAHDLLKINPLTGLFESYRDVFLYGQTPAAWELLYPLGFAAVLIGIFVPVYRREQRHFAKVVE